MTYVLSCQIEIPAPKTNMKWAGEVSAEPAWAKDLVIPVSPGLIRLKFSASNPRSNQEGKKCN